MRFTELSLEPVVVLPGRSLALMSTVLHQEHHVAKEA